MLSITYDKIICLFWCVGSDCLNRFFAVIESNISLFILSIYCLVVCTRLFTSPLTRLAFFIVCDHLESGCSRDVILCKTHQKPDWPTLTHCPISGLDRKGIGQSVTSFFIAVRFECDMNLCMLLCAESPCSNRLFNDCVPDTSITLVYIECLEVCARLSNRLWPVLPPLLSLSYRESGC